MNTNPGNKKKWKKSLGEFLFKFRSFTPLPLVVLVFLFFPPIVHGWLWDLFGLGISVFGQMIRVIAVGYSSSGTSGRETFLKADHLNMTGLYSLVRNPLYIGNLLIFNGVLIVYGNILAILLFNLFLSCQYYFIILIEEEYLLDTHGKVYQQYCQQVSRILPSFRFYLKPGQSFNLIKVVFRENDSVFNTLMMVLIILLYRQLRFHRHLGHTLFYYIGTWIILVGLYLFVKIKKKQKQAKKID